MRLLEPLQGVKVAQGHNWVHIIFFISISILDKDKEYDLKYMTLGKTDHGSANGHRMLFRDLASGSVEKVEHDEFDLNAQLDLEQMLFNLIYYGHLVVFLA